MPGGGVAAMRKTDVAKAKAQSKLIEKARTGEEGVIRGKP